MNESTQQAVYRLCRRYRKSDVPKKYSGTYELIDDDTKQVMAVCDLVGRAVFATLTIKDHQDGVWQMKPNRRIMPSRWIITGPGDNVAMQFDQKILGKMINPIYKIVLALLDREGQEVFRLVDPRTSIPDRVLGVSPSDWAVMRNDTPVAKLTHLPREEKPGKGILGKIRKFFTLSDRGIVSAGGEHALPAPVALGMLLLFDELTDTSAPD